MAQLVVNCPRCGARGIAFDVLHTVRTDRGISWEQSWEAFSLCGHCRRTTIFRLSQRHSHTSDMLAGRGAVESLKGSINEFVSVDGFVNIANVGAVSPPDHLPQEVADAFNEGAKCMAIGCYNGGGTMFRLCVDHASRGKLPTGVVVGLNHRTRRDLGLRMAWLFDNGLLPEALRDLSTSIREDGNDGAHRGTLTKDDALDIQEFTVALLERIYTEPERLRLAAERRDARRAVV